MGVVGAIDASRWIKSAKVLYRLYFSRTSLAFEVEVVGVQL
jgi:hypothetical protein